MEIPAGSRLRRLLTRNSAHARGSGRGAKRKDCAPIPVAGFPRSVHSTGACLYGLVNLSLSIGQCVVAGSTEQRIGSSGKRPRRLCTTDDLRQCVLHCPAAVARRASFLSVGRVCVAAMLEDSVV